LRRAADAFDTHGMISLFRPTKAQREDHHRSLPVPMRQLIVDRKRRVSRFYPRRDRQYLCHPVQRTTTEQTDRESGLSGWATAFPHHPTISAR
jgi:hypothetical protein